MNKRVLIAVGSVAALGASYSIYANIQQKQKDKLAAAIIRAIHPSSSGLAVERAFEIHYKDEVLRRIPGKLFMLSASKASQLAKEIESAFGAWWQGGDDEDKLYGVFRKLKDKVQVSQVALAYYQQYKINLVDKLYDKLSKKEVEFIFNIVKGLPAYRKAI